jgi:hypothetical protein
VESIVAACMLREVKIFSKKYQKTLAIRNEQCYNTNIERGKNIFKLQRRTKERGESTRSAD